MIVELVGGFAMFVGAFVQFEQASYETYRLRRLRRTFVGMITTARNRRADFFAKANVAPRAPI